MKHIQVSFRIAFFVAFISIHCTHGLLLFSGDKQCHKLNTEHDHYCPTQRYCGWNALTTQEKVLVRAKLGYSMNAWNYVRINQAIEKTSFVTLTEDERDALEIIGFNEDSHDCCHGHYEDYSWADFDIEGYEWVKYAWETFGYNQTTWDNGVLLESVDQFWDDLTEEQQTAMSEEVCYTRELWNQVPIPTWPDNVTLPGLIEPTSQPTLIPTNNPTKIPSKKPSSNPSSSPSTSPTIKPSAAPTSNPTVSPTKMPSSAPTLNPTMLTTIETATKNNESGFIEDLITQIDEMVHNQTITELFSAAPSPSTLPKIVSTAPSAFQTFADSDSDESINNVTNIETDAPLDISTLSTEPPATAVQEMSTSPPSVIDEAALMESVMAKIDAMTSTTLPPTTTPIDSNSEEGLIENLITQIEEGLQNQTIPNTSPPSTTPVIIEEGTETTASNATIMPTIVPALTPTMSPAPSPVPINITDHLTPCRDLDPDLFYYCPPVRYCIWESQTLTTTLWFTQQLSYDRLSWNMYSDNLVETSWFEDLPLSQQRDLESFGFDIARHECCMNHYENYGWRMFDRWNMTETKAAWETLGYDEEKWNNGLPTEFDDLWFDELPEAVQTALTDQLCYTEELWNAVPLDFWPEDATLPGTYELSESSSDSSSSSYNSESQWLLAFNICAVVVTALSFV